MSKALIANNAASTLAADLADDDTSLTIQSADAGLFPSPSGGDWFPLTLIGGDGGLEIVHVTARASATLTVSRAQEGTSARAFSAGNKAELRATAGALPALIDTGDFATAAQGATADSALQPGDIGTTSGTVAAGDDSRITGAEQVANKNVADGYAGLDSSGKVAAAQLPSYVDQVLEYANLAAFPGTGEVDKIYVALDSEKIYRWSGSTYVEISPSPGSTDAVTEGSTNLYFTAARVRAVVLTGLSTATSAVIAATDTVLGAMGKLQAQISGHLADTDNPHAVTKAQVGLGNVDNTSNATERAAAATLTNKRVTPRVGSTASSSTPTPSADDHDQYEVTALAAAATFGAPSGTPSDAQKLVVRIKDDGTARAIDWNAIYRALGANLPTTTTVGKTTYVGLIYNAAATTWDCVAVAQES